MPKFDYVALDARGQESRGTMDAASQNDVVLQLRQAGLFPTSVAEAKAGAKPAKAGGSKEGGRWWGDVSAEDGEFEGADDFHASVGNTD